MKLNRQRVIELSPLFARLPKFAPLLLVLLSAIVAAGAYLQAFNYQFLIDDGLYIVENKKLAGLQLTEIWRLITTPYTPFLEFLPVRDLSYWFDMTLFGLNPSAFRMHNIFLYLLCLPLVYGTTLALWRYFRPSDVTSAPWAAAAVTALFALHPSHTETVVWIAARKDVLSCLFSLLALWLAVRARREHGLSVPYATATLVAFAAAAFSKILCIPVVLVIAMLWVIFWRDIPAPNRRRSMLLWPIAILALAGLLAWVFMAFSKQKATFYFGVEAVTRSFAVLGWLARLTVSPESRHFLHPVFEDTYFPVMAALGLAVLAAAVVGAGVLLRKRSLEGWALVAFVLLCLPYIQLVPYVPPSLVSDRWLALAAWPIILLLVALSWRLKPLLRTALLVAIALPWGFQTIQRPHNWSSFEALVETDLRAYPGYYMPAVYKIIGVLLPKGLRQEAMETASSITNPEVRDLMVKLIRANTAARVEAISTGKPQEAVSLLWQLGLDLKQVPAQAQWDSPIQNAWGEGSTRLNIEWKFLTKKFPDDALVRYYAGLWLLSTNFGGAADNLRAAVESKRLPEPLRGNAYKNFGLALLYGGHVVEAEIPLLAALEQIPPDFRAYCALSFVYRQTGRIEEAAHAEAECRSRMPSEVLAQ